MMNPPALLALFLLMIVVSPDRVEALAFSWATWEFGMCSDECGGGLATRSIECRDEFSNLVTNSFCDADNIPTATQSCNSQDCTCPADEFVSDDGSCVNQGGLNLILIKAAIDRE